MHNFSPSLPPSLQPLEEALADYRLNSAHDYPREAATTRLVERGYSVGVGFLLGGHIRRTDHRYCRCCRMNCLCALGYVYHPMPLPSHACTPAAPYMPPPNPSVQWGSQAMLYSPAMVAGLRAHVGAIVSGVSHSCYVRTCFSVIAIAVT